MREGPNNGLIILCLEVIGLSKWWEFYVDSTDYNTKIKGTNAASGYFVLAEGIMICLEMQIKITWVEQLFIGYKSRFT